MLATMASLQPANARRRGLSSTGNAGSSSEGCRITFRDGRPNVTDAPFTENRELLAGYSILDVDSL